MKFIDKFIPLKGHFLVKVENVITGKNWIHYEDPNTITLIAKRDTIRLLGNDLASDRIITKMKFGNGGHVSNPLDPNYGQALPTYETQTDLVGTYIFTKNITSVTYYDDMVLNTSQGTFKVVMSRYEGNGPSGTQIYSEAGLFTFNETLSYLGVPNSGLFAVKNFPIISKTSDIQLTFDWTIIL